jgi:hypothetical protein
LPVTDGSVDLHPIKLLFGVIVLSCKVSLGSHGKRKLIVVYKKIGMFLSVKEGKVIS